MQRMVVLGLWFCVAASALAEPNWATFRGPTQGISAETGLPVTWSEQQNVTWKVAVPGRGWSSPVIWGDQIWMTTAVEHRLQDAETGDTSESSDDSESEVRSIELRAICVDRVGGKVVANVLLFTVDKPDKIHSMNSYASPTPVIEDGRLYCHFGTFGTACVDTGAKQILWQRQLQTAHSVGPGSSPVVWQNLLILVCDGLEQQYVTALDKTTGQDVWKTPRPKLDGDNGEFHKAFCTPLTLRWQDQDLLLVTGAQWFVAYQPATGEMVWWLKHGRGFSNVPVPVFADGIAYLTTGFMRAELWAVPVGQTGELRADNVLWEQKRQVPKRATPVLAAGDLYMVSDNGVLSCVNRHNGRLRWSARLGGNYSASPLLVDGRLYLMSHEGQITVIEPNSEKLVTLAENQLDGQLMASPVPNNGALYVRSDSALYRIEQN